jgi:hypothetical protein
MGPTRRKLRAKRIGILSSDCSGSRADRIIVKVRETNKKKRDQRARHIARSIASHRDATKACRSLLSSRIRSRRQDILTSHASETPFGPRARSWAPLGSRHSPFTTAATFISHAPAGGRSLEVRDAAGHCNVSITGGCLHMAVEDDVGVGNLFRLL